MIAEVAEAQLDVRVLADTANIRTLPDQHTACLMTRSSSLRPGRHDLVHARIGNQLPQVFCHMAL